jgi:hypothetical protein
VQVSDKGKLTVGEAGQRGGKQTAAKHGRAHFVRIAHLAHDAIREKYGPNYYVELGKHAAAVRYAKRSTVDSEALQ